MAPDDAQPLTPARETTENKSFGRNGNLTTDGRAKGAFAPGENAVTRTKRVRKLTEKQVQQIADGMSHAAMATLAEIMGDPKQKANCRLRAAETILAYAAGKPVSMLHLSTDDPAQSNTPAAPVKTKEELDREAFEKVLQGAAEKAGTALTFQPVAPIVSAGAASPPAPAPSDKEKMVSAVMGAIIDAADIKPE